MKKVSILILCFLFLSGCGKSITELEKISIASCEVVVGQTKEGNSVLRVNKEDYILSDEVPVETVKLSVIPEFFGKEAFAVSYEMGYAPMVEYYGIQDGKPIALCNSWGNREADNYLVDLDQDGESELVCNVRYLADGVPGVIVYKNIDGRIMKARPVYIPEEFSGDVLWREISCEYSPEDHKITEMYSYIQGDSEKGQDLVRQFDLNVEDLEFYEETMHSYLFTNISE